LTAKVFALSLKTNGASGSAVSGHALLEPIYPFLGGLDSRA